VGHVRADLPVRALHPLLDLGKKRVSQPLGAHSLRYPALLPQRHIAGDGVVVTAGQLGRRAIAAGQVVGLQDLHDLLRCPQCSSLEAIGRGGFKASTPAGTNMTASGESPGHQRGDP
jgi:hypothetical protein